MTLSVFDRREADTDSLEPYEPYPARFVSMEAAIDALDRIKASKDGSWSVFDGALHPFVDGKLNQLWMDSPFELRIYEA